MSDVDGTCEYVLDPDDPETWGGEEDVPSRSRSVKITESLNKDGVWACPHDTEDGEDLCIFHLPVDEKDDEAVLDAFLNSIETASESTDPKTQRQNLQFLGARFGTFKLSEDLSEFVIEDGGISLSYTTIDGEFRWSVTGFNMDYLHLGTVTFSDNFDISQTILEGEIYFNNAIFEGKSNFTETEFGEYADFSFAEFRDGATFSNAEFNGLTTFESAVFGDEADFSQTTFETATDPPVLKVDDIDTRFTQVTFAGGASFEEAVFRGNTDLGGVAFRSANFRETEFQGNVFFRDAECEYLADFGRAVFSGIASFLGVKFGGGVIDLEGKLKGEIGGGADFTGVSFEEKADFSGSRLEHALFDGTNLTDAVFSGARLCNAAFESALLSRATLFGADLRGTKLSGAVLGDVRIDEDTKFLGHPSTDSESSPHTLSAICSRPCCVYDPRYGTSRDSIQTRIRRKFSSLISSEDSIDEPNNEHEDVDRAKSVYRALEELGGKHARPRLQARSFVRRQNLQKDEYKQDAKDADSWEERLIAGARWGRAKMARATLLYGESPWRVIAWSLGIIFSFALLYPIGGWMKPTDGDPITYAQIASNPAEILNSVYYSTLTYTALGFGDFQPVGLGRMLTTLETGLGAVMLALLVFILGRRAAR